MTRYNETLREANDGREQAEVPYQPSRPYWYEQGTKSEVWLRHKRQVKELEGMLEEMKDARKPF